MKEMQKKGRNREGIKKERKKEIKKERKTKVN